MGGTRLEAVGTKLEAVGTKLEDGAGANVEAGAKLDGELGANVDAGVNVELGAKLEAGAKEETGLGAAAAGLGAAGSTLDLKLSNSSDTKKYMGIKIKKSIFRKIRKILDEKFSLPGLSRGLSSMIFTVLL